MITITLDAMGGDHAPAVTVHGAVWAARDFGVTVQLVGQSPIIEAELAKHKTDGLHLPIVPASQVIEMAEHPSSAVKNKKDSSMVVGVNQVKTGESQAFVTMGNSGGALAAALFGLGRIKGIKRPALGAVFPADTPAGYTLLIDAGANTDVKAEYLLQFALMGHHYVQRVTKIPQPRIGLLSTGEEEDKGNALVQEATPLLKQSGLNFIGNVEGKDIPAGLADVVVTDGFTGNVYLKGAEGVASMMMTLLKREVKARPLAMLGMVLARGALNALKKRLDYREFGGAVLLGVNGVTIIGHGRSDEYAIRNAIRVAKETVEQNVIGAIEAGLTSCLFLATN